MSWPAAGEADLVLPGVLSFAPAGFTNSVPIASLTKVMTTLVLLQDYPLAPGETGPMIMVTDGAVIDTAAKLADNATLLPILAGERLSEAQAIQAMLVVSANNIADLVATWDAGSQSAFVAKMNALAASWGMSSTHFDDPSGLSADSRSSAADVLTLAQRALGVPLIRADVALTSAVLPYAPDATTTTPTTATDPNAPPHRRPRQQPLLLLLLIRCLRSPMSRSPTRIPISERTESSGSRLATTLPREAASSLPQRLRLAPLRRWPTASFWDNKRPARSGRRTTPNS